MGPSRFELESEDPQSPRMPGYPMAPIPYYFLTSDICTYPFVSERPDGGKSPGYSLNLIDRLCSWFMSEMGLFLFHRMITRESLVFMEGSHTTTIIYLCRR